MIDFSIKRAMDLTMSGAAAAVLALPALIVASIVRLTSPGPALYWSDRIGRDNQIFRMPKFRTMRVNAPQVASHLLSDPASHLTPVGAFLRKSSLDEIPQLWSILRGDMSVVGPRPALFNQDDLVALRTARGVHRVMPGLTGWAQINGRDELSIEEKVTLDEEYCARASVRFDLWIVARTAIIALTGRGVSH